MTSKKLTPATARNTFVPAILVLLSIAVPVDDLAAQDATAPETIVVSDEVACTDCRIEFEHVIRLGGKTADAGLVCSSPFSGGLAVSRDRFYVPECRAASVLVFDRLGNLLGRVGRQGSGPGEFPDHGLGVFAMVDGGLVVFARGQRATRFSPELEFMHQFHQRGPIDVEGVDDGRMVLSYPARTPDLIGYPLHVHEPSGEYTRSIGDRDAVIDLRQGSSSSLVGKVGIDRAGNKVWSVFLNEYRMELLDLEGHVHRVVVRDGWFKPWTAGGGNPTVDDMMQDETGVLWVVLTRPGFEPTPGGPHGFRIVVEAIDVESGVLLATRTLTLGEERPVFAGRYAWQRVLVGDDEFIDVSRLSVVR